jgi:hypothetical protein
VHLTVRDAPPAVTGLVVTKSNKSQLLSVKWNASLPAPQAGGSGAAPISYKLQACYPTPPRSLGVLCDNKGLIPAFTAPFPITFPAVHAAQFIGDFTAAYIYVLVTPVDANNVEGGAVLGTPTIIP